jgi:hypothetical protein
MNLVSRLLLSSAPINALYLLRRRKGPTRYCFWPRRRTLKRSLKRGCGYSLLLLAILPFGFKKWDTTPLAPRNDVTELQQIIEPSKEDVISLKQKRMKSV